MERKGKNKEMKSNKKGKRNYVIIISKPRSVNTRKFDVYWKENEKK